MAPGSSRIDPPDRLSRWHARWSRLLDGDRVWGSFSIPTSRRRISRYGVSQYRLVVFPPGISRGQRRWLRLWLAWPTWGAVLWVASDIYLSSTVSNWAAVGIATAVYATTGAGTLILVRGLRPQVRTLSVSVVDRRPDRRSAVICDELATLVHVLSEADALRASGELSVLDHETVWQRVYDRLGPGRPEPTDHQPSI